MALGEVVIGAVAVVGSILLYTVVAGFPAGAIIDSIGPRLWPTMSLGGIALCGALLLVKAVPGLKAKEEPDDEDWVKSLKLLALIVVCLWLMQVIGFILATPLMLAATGLFMGIRKARTLVLFSLIFALALMGFFLYVLYIPLPKGIGPFMLFSNMFY